MPVYVNKIQEMTSEEHDISMAKQFYVDGKITFKQFEEYIERILQGELLINLMQHMTIPPPTGPDPTLIHYIEL